MTQFELDRDEQALFMQFSKSREAMRKALAEAREQGRREMQRKAAQVADEEAAGCETKRVVPGDLERNYFGGGLRASAAIAAAIRALKA